MLLGPDFAQLWADNQESLLSFLELGYKSVIVGVVTDARTNLPLPCAVYPSVSSELTTQLHK